MLFPVRTTPKRMLRVPVLAAASAAPGSSGTYSPGMPMEPPAL